MTLDLAIAGAIMLVIMGGMWFLMGKKAKVSSFDEMQQRIRGDAYRLGWFTTMILSVGLMILSELGAFRYVSPSFGMFAVLTAGVFVFAVYCIRHGALLSVRESSGSRIGLFALITVCNGAVALYRLLSGQALENGVLTLSFGAPALLCAGFLALVIAMLLKQASDRKETDE